MEEHECDFKTGGRNIPCPMLICYSDSWKCRWTGSSGNENWGAMKNGTMIKL